MCLATMAHDHDQVSIWHAATWDSNKTATSSSSSNNFNANVRKKKENKHLTENQNIVSTHCKTNATHYSKSTRILKQNKDLYHIKLYHKTAIITVTKISFILCFSKKQKKTKQILNVYIKFITFFLFFWLNTKQTLSHNKHLTQLMSSEIYYEH